MNRAKEKASHRATLFLEGLVTRQLVVLALHSALSPKPEYFLILSLPLFSLFTYILYVSPLLTGNTSTTRASSREGLPQFMAIW